MLVGSSRVDITPKLCPLCGQMYVRQAEYVHDPLYCNTVVFKNKGKLFVFVSNDVITMNKKMVPQLKKELSEKYNAPEKCFCFHAIHTHLAPYTNENPGVCEENTEFVSSWKEKIKESVEIAMNNLEECDLYSGRGYIEYMGFNRRGRRKDGSVEMYYGAWNDDFMGCEGPRDGEVTVLFAKTKAENKLKVIVPNFSTHPNAIESESFISADLVGRTRQVLRSIFGENVDIVYITGAAGNTAPTDLYRKDGVQHWRFEEGWNRSGIYLGAEIAKVVASACEPMESDFLDTEEVNLEVPYRDLNVVLEKKRDEITVSESFDGDIKLLKENEKKGSMIVNVTVARIGNTVLCSSACELYCEFGLDIKVESPAEHTIIAELTNGSIGYVPTYEATINGGFSAVVPGSVCKEDTGYRITAETKKIMLKLFMEDK
ncbi:MAG: neutral/alkaline non-lysosomal ceramidase N-terminal domain-containing protein [Armatimonadetes bacterium]|nr:neutral/alkaline non-lysosomal ceramidase N-terminal domain-containing protein [Candidatus Hippobium faecium]